MGRCTGSAKGSPVVCDARDFANFADAFRHFSDLKEPEAAAGGAPALVL